MTEHAKTVVRRYFTEVLNKGNYDLIKDLFSPSFIFSGPSTKRPISGMPERIYDFVATLRRAFPDLFVSIENSIAEENQVVVIWRMTGTHERAFRRIKATHRHCSITGMDIFTIENGRIEGMWAFFEMQSLLEQLPVKSLRAPIKKSVRTTATAKKRKER